MSWFWAGRDLGRRRGPRHRRCGRCAGGRDLGRRRGPSVRTTGGCLGGGGALDRDEVFARGGAPSRSASPGRGRGCSWSRGGRPVAAETFADPPKDPPRDPPASFRVSPHESDRGGRRWVRLCSALDADWCHTATSPPGRTAFRGELTRTPALRVRTRPTTCWPCAESAQGRWPLRGLGPGGWEGCRHGGSAHVVDDRSTNGGRLGRAGDAGMELDEVLEGLEEQAADVADHRATTGGPAQG